MSLEGYAGFLKVHQEQKKLIEITATHNTIKIRGHAGYAEQGHDIVCAGVTALTQALINSVQELTEDEIEYIFESGIADIELRNVSERSETLIHSFFIGVDLIADEFPKYVKVYNRL